MRLRKILTVLLIAAAFSTASFTMTAYAAGEPEPVSIVVAVYGPDGADDIKSCTIFEDLTINGTVSIGVPLDLDGYKVVINGNVVQTSNINIGSGELIVNGNFTQSGGSITFDEGGKLTVDGNFNQMATVSVDQGEMNVSGEYYQTNGKLTIGSGKLTVQSDYNNRCRHYDEDGSTYYTGSYGTLNMTDDDGYFLVGGDMYFYSTNNNSTSANYITAGTLELKGNFEQGQCDSCFNATGTHKLILSGNEKQTLVFNSPGSSGFNILYSTPNANTDIKGRISAIGENVTVANFDQYQTLHLEDNTFNVTGNMTAHGSVYADTGKLNVNGDYLQDSGRLQIDSGSVKVNGDFRFLYENGTKEDGSINYTGSTAVLNMTEDDGYLGVDGDMYFYSTNNNSTSANYITAGTLELKGNFEQGQCDSCFNATGTHKLILSGNEKQTLVFNSPGSSGFNILYSTPNTNTDIKGRISSIGENVTVANFNQYQTLKLGENTLNVTDNMTAHGSIYANTGKLNVGGNYLQDSGRLQIDSGSVKVGGDFRFEYENSINEDGSINYTGSTAVLNMTEDDGYLGVDGDMYFYSTNNNSTSANYITAGTLELKGNFEQGQCDSCFDAKGTHKLILSGDKKQTLVFNSPGSSGFNILYSTPNANTDIKGRISAIGENVTVANFDQYQTLHLEDNTFNVTGNMTAHGSVYADTGNLNVKKNYLQDSGRLQIDSGSVKVNGDFRFLYENGTKEDGSINYTGSTAVLNMTEDDGYLGVDGDMYFYSTNNNSTTANYITAGTLELKGNFEQGQCDSCFDAKGTHKLILSGDKKQTLVFGSPYCSGFNILSSTTNHNTHIKGRISKIGANVEVGSFEQYQSLDVNGKTLTVNGKLYAFGKVYLNGGTIKAGQYTQCAGRLEIQDGKLFVDGDFRFEYENSTNEDGSINYTGSTAVLNMTDEKGYMCVGGDMYFYSTNNNSTSNNCITAGTLELKGNFEQGQCDSCFDAKGTHKLILSGDKKQTLVFGSPYSSGFNILSSTTNHNTHIKGRISKIGANVEVGSFEQYQSLDVNGKTLTVNGKLYAFGKVYLNGGTIKAGQYTQCAGRLEIQDGKLFVDGDFRFEYENGTKEDGSINYTGSTAVLNMTDEKGYMCVGGDMYFYSTNNNSTSANCITAGTLELKGNFEQGQCDSCFDAKGTHQTIFSGTETQTAYFASPKSSTFNILNISRNPLASQVAAAPHKVLVTSLDLTNLSAPAASEIKVGEIAKIIGLASGGTEPYAYAFFYKKTTETDWNSLAYGTDRVTVANFRPTAAAEYDIKVVVVDNDGAQSEKNFTINVKPEDPLVNNTTVTKTDFTVGESITVKGAATGGSGKYTYEFYYKRSTVNNWTKFGSNGTGTFQPGSAGTFTIRTYVKDSNGKAAMKEFTLTASVPQLTNNTTVTKTNFTVGESITVKGAATGGSGTYTYEFYYKRSTVNNWTKFGSNGTGTFKPGSAGTFTIRTYVKDSSGKTSMKEFTLVATDPALTNDTTVSKLNFTVGETITVKGAASGGSGKYTYEFYYRRSTVNTWTKFDKNGTGTFKPGSAGTFIIRTYVKDSNGKTVMKEFTLTATAPLTNNTTVTKTNFNVGESITVKGAATGGSGTYTYEFYYKRSTVNTWTRFDKNGTGTFKPGSAGTFTIKTYVKDSDGKAAVKEFTLTAK